MKISFEPLAKIEFVHSYFPDGLVPGLSLRASASTMSLFQTRRYLQRDSGGGIQLLKKSGESAEERFVFFAQVNNPDFFKLTRLPTKKGVVLFASNISKGSSVAAGEWAIFPVRGERFEVNVNELIEGAGFGFATEHAALQKGGAVLLSYYLEDLSGNVVYQSNEFLCNGTIEVDLSGVEDAYYEIVVELAKGARLPATAFVLNSGMANMNPLAVVEWWGGQSEEENFSMTFEEVLSLWRYYVLADETRYRGSFSVSSEKVNGVEVSFQQTLSSKTPSGSEAACFVSDRAIPLRAEPSGNIELEGSEGSVSIPLPYAEPGYVLEERYGKTAVYNNIYVEI